MIRELRMAIGKCVGPSWRVTAACSGGDEVIVDVDCGRAGVLRARGKTLEEAELRATRRLLRRAMWQKARWQEDHLEEVLRGGVARAKRLRGLPAVRLVVPARPREAAANDGGPVDVDAGIERANGAAAGVGGEESRTEPGREDGDDEDPPA